MEEELVFGDILDPEKEDSEDTLSWRDLCLNMVLPISLAGSIHYTSIGRYKEEVSSFHLCWKMAETVQILTGSSSDGLSLPEVIEIKNGKRLTEGSDEDILYLFTSLKVDASDRRAFCYMDSGNSPAGFTKLVFNENWLSKRPSKIHREKSEDEMIKRHVPSFIENDDTHYIIRRNLLRILRKHMRDEIHNKQLEVELININQVTGLTPDVSFSQHGPAITVDLTNRQDHISETTTSKDYVVALPVPRWPKEASDWINRPRVWPPRQLVRKIVKGGCHIVLKGDTIYDDSRDFLISFSGCEKLLGLSLKIKQKRCYILFKYLFKYAINKVRRGLTTYHCKCVFYYCCERVPENKWLESQPFECLMWLLNDLEACLKKRFLPQYFIPEMNMISRISTKQIDAILRDLSYVKQNPVKVTIELTKSKRFPWISDGASFSNMLSSITTEAKITKEAAQAMVVDFIEYLLDKGEVAVAISVLGDTDNSDIMPRTDYIIEVLENAVQTDCGNKSVSIKGLLASVYLQRALEQNQENILLRSSSYFDKSRCLFKDITNDIQSHIWILGEYFDMLYLVGDYCEIIRCYQSLLNDRSGDSSLVIGGIYTTKASHNRLTAERELREIGEFTVPTVMYLTYKTALASLQLTRILETNTLEHTSNLVAYSRKLTRRMIDWLREKRHVCPEYTDENIYILLGLLNKEMGDTDGLEKYFDIAEHFNFTYGERGDDLIRIPPLTKDMKKDKRKYEDTSCFRVRKRKRDTEWLNQQPDLRTKKLKLNAFTHY